VCGETRLQPKTAGARSVSSRERRRSRARGATEWPKFSFPPSSVRNLRPDAQTFMRRLSARITHYSQVHPPRVDQSSQKSLTVPGRSEATTRTALTRPKAGSRTHRKSSRPLPTAYTRSSESRAHSICSEAHLQFTKQTYPRHHWRGALSTPP
jgi:hypothetical protein